MVRTEDTAREKRLRRMADRRGWTLHKCPRRDPLATGYGLYRLDRKGAPQTDAFPHTLDDVERKLNGLRTAEEEAAAPDFGQVLLHRLENPEFDDGGQI